MILPAPKKSPTSALQLQHPKGSTCFQGQGHCSSSSRSPLVKCTNNPMLLLFCCLPLGYMLSWKEYPSVLLNRGLKIADPAGVLSRMEVKFEMCQICGKQDSSINVRSSTAQPPVSAETPATARKASRKGLLSDSGTCASVHRLILAAGMLETTLNFEEFEG